MPLYSVEMTIAATLYVRADTPAEAVNAAEALAGGDVTDTDICGLAYDDPLLPDVSFSPAMTVTGINGEPVAYLVDGATANEEAAA